MNPFKKILFLSFFCILVVSRILYNTVWEQPERDKAMKRFDEEEAAASKELSPVSFSGTVVGIKSFSGTGYRIRRDLFIKTDSIKNYPGRDSCYFFSKSGDIIRIRIDVGYVCDGPSWIYEGYRMVKKENSDSLSAYDMDGKFVSTTPDL